MTNEFSAKTNTITSSAAGRAAEQQQRAGIHLSDNRESAVAQRKLLGQMNGNRNETVQPKAVTGSVVQRVSTGKSYKTSENSNYRTLIDDTNYLGVKGTAAAPQPGTLITATGNKTSGYNEYKFSGGAFENDCLSFAKRLCNEIAGRNIRESLRVKLNNGASTNVGFAVLKPPVNPLVEEYNDNDVADHPQFNQKQHANPGIGESYVTVPKSGVHVVDCSFHVAAVVAKDGSDNITCEANAADDTRTEPVFDMYETVPGNKLTFHARYKSDYGGVYATTGVLKAASGIWRAPDFRF